MRVEKQIEYEAKNDAEAIQVARDRLGRDAVILSSRPVKLGGVLGFFKRDALWVTAGLLEPDPEDLAKEARERMVAFQHLLDVRRAVTGEPEPKHKAPEAHHLPASPFMPPQAATQAYEANSPQKEQPLTKQVDEIKEILSRVLVRLDSNEEPPMEEKLPPEVSLLAKADVDERIAWDIVREYEEGESGKPFKNWLSASFPTMGTESRAALGGKKILFAGPTGVGKTTTIAKIAAGESLWEGRKVVLITADTYRIAAVEQLRTYAKILGIPIEVATAPEEVAAAVKRHPDADLFLLDTAGRSHHDSKRMDELQALYDSFSPDAVHLVLAANIKYRDMLDVIDRMGVVPLTALLFTKLDETSSYGTVLNIVRDFSLPVSFFTVGQNVPNDIEIARGDRFVDFLLENKLHTERLDT